MIVLYILLGFIIGVIFIIYLYEKKPRKENDKEPYITEMWCDDCQKETKQEIRGEGFNEYNWCLECEQKEDKQ